MLFQYPQVAYSPQQAGEQPAAELPPVALPRRQAQLLLAALPKLGEALAAVAEAQGPSLQHSARTVSAAAAVTTLLAGATREEADGGRPAAVIEAMLDLPAWLHGAATALRLLPAVVKIADQEQGRGPGSSMQTRPSEVACAALSLAVAAGWSAYPGVRLPDAGWAAQDAAVKAECLAGLWQLHTAACRAAHAVLAGAIPQHLISLVAPQVMYLLPLVSEPFKAASFIYCYEEGGVGGLPSNVAG